MHCPKHVEFHVKNKFAKLVHLVGPIIKKLSRVVRDHVFENACSAYRPLRKGRGYN